MGWLYVDEQKQIHNYHPAKTKLISQWIKDLSIKLYKLNPIEEKVWNSLEHIATGDNFLNRTSIAQAQGSTVNK